jgi:hypothetical protein
LGASSRVKAADSVALIAPFGPNGVTATSWTEWVEALKAEDTELLVLLPHTDYGSISLEIADDELQRSHIETEHVSRHPNVRPVVLLFGCRTTGEADDPVGFATRFLTKGARAVFHSSTDLLNVHATRLASQLMADLADKRRPPHLLSESLAEFRRKAVHEGLIAAFAISAYGDADWRV